MRNLATLVILLALAACGSSPENHYYTLSAIGSPRGMATDIVVNHVSIPDLLDRPQMIMISGANTVTVMEYQRWAEPLDSMIKRVLAQDMSVSQTMTKHTRKVAVTIDELDSNEQGQVTLRASWTTQSPAVATPYKFEKTSQAVDATPDAIAAMMSQLLADFAKTIR